MADMRGIVGRNLMKQKWAGFTQMRKGVKGYSKDYANVMNMHAAQVFRTQELSKLNHKLQPTIEALRTNGKPGLADAIQSHLTDLWGTPSKFEQDFGRELQKIPLLKDHVANPSMAFRGLARRLTGLQMTLKLKASPRAALVNRLQVFSTLWPYVSTKDFAAASAEVLKPRVRKIIAERGVLSGSGKIESTGVGAWVRHTGSGLAPWNWFQRASDANRALGYWVGYKEGLRKGMSEAKAHDLGLSWAEKTEFDNSTWNIQPILRSPGARVIGQFKSFAGKNLENVRDVFAPEKLPIPQRVGRIAKWGTAQIGIGGVKSLGVAAKVFGGYKIVKALQQQLQARGMDKDDAEKYAKAVYYGAPSLLGQDLSASVAILEEPYGRTPLEQAGNFFFGPTIGGGINVASNLVKGNMSKAAQQATPAFKPANTIAQRIQSGDWTTDIKTGNKQSITLSPFESVMYGLGFTPLQQTEVYDKKDAGIKSASSPADKLRKRLRDRVTPDKPKVSNFIK